MNKAKEHSRGAEYRSVAGTTPLQSGGGRRVPEYVERDLIHGLIYPFRRLRHYVLVALAVSTTLNLILWTDSLSSVKLFIIAMFWSLSHWVVQSMGNGYVIHLIDHRISWLESPWKRAIVGFVSLVLFSAPAFLVVQLTFIYLYSGGLPSPLFDYVLASSRLAITISFVIAFIFTSVGFLREWRKSTIEAGELRAEMMTYKYESLRNQINPHFLFNSLNTLSDLVYEDQEVAVKFIRQLSDLYRYVLDSREREVVPLREELEFISSFSYLLETRFEDKLEISVDVPVEHNDLIVPMALQNLMENAVKHNEVSSQYPLQVEMYRENDRLVVSNPVRPKSIGEESTRTGLGNIRARYEFLTDEEIIVDESDGRFTVSLPILKEVSE